MKMKRLVSMGWLAACLCTGLLVVGCASYYKVKDVQSGKEYYTQKIDSERGGAVRLKDARTGSIVTLQSSEVKEISSEAYQAGLKAPASKPDPAPAAAAPASPAPTAAPAATPAPAAPASEAPAAPAETK